MVFIASGKGFPEWRGNILTGGLKPGAGAAGAQATGWWKVPAHRHGESGFTMSSEAPPMARSGC
jgi:hypothetical protein